MRGPAFTLRRFERLATPAANGNGNGNGHSPGKEPSVDELCDAVATLTPDERSAERLAALQSLLAAGAEDAPVKLIARLMTRPGGSTPADRDVLRRLAEGTPGGMERASLQLVSLLGTSANDSRAITMLTWLVPESVEPVIAALHDPVKQQLAAVALGYMRDARAADALRAVMIDSPDPDSSRAAAWALGKIGDPETGRALLAAAADRPPPAEAGPDSEHAPSFAPASVRAVDFDGLAELYEIAVEAWHAAAKNDDEHESERWQAIVDGIVDEARGRPVPDATDENGGGRRFVGRRRERRRARLLAARGGTALGA
ncbi:MAG: HEAT repeat domain-containing protein [Thermoleophilaceae bacterium]